jgi:hypothetical protein
MKFYVLRPLVSVPNEVNIFGPHLQIRLVETISSKKYMMTHRNLTVRR